MTPKEVMAMCASQSKTRLTKVLGYLGVATSSWYHRRIPKDLHRPRGPAKKPIDPDLLEAVKKVAKEFPMWGYKRIAIVCRRRGIEVGNKKVYRIFKQLGLLQKPRPKGD